MAVVSLTTVADTHVMRNRNQAEGMNFGGDTGLAALNTSSEYAEVYVLFDLSSIPSASKINSATFKLELVGGGYLNITVDMRKVTSGWQEYAVTYHNKPSISNEVYGSILSPHFNPPDPVIASFDATAMVREWISGKSPNYGFALTSPNGNRIFSSREGAAAYGHIPPTLVIDYEPNHAPNAPGLNTPGHGSITNNRNPVFNWMFSDQDGGDYQTAWQIQVSAGDGGAFTNIYMDSGKNTTATNQWTFYNFGDNQYFYRIRTWDRYDAVSPWSWVPWFGIENQPPTCTGGTPSPRYLKVDPGGSFRVEVTGVSDNWSGVRNVQFATWTEANGQDDIRWYDGVNAGNGTWYFDVPIANHGNAEGKYLCHVYAWDHAGNSANIRVIDTYIDRTPPTVASVQGYSYSNQTGGTRRVWIYGAADAVSGIAAVEAHYVKVGMNWNGPYAAGQSGGDFYFDAPVYAGDGEYLVHFYLRDRAGNQSGPHEVKFFVDSQRANDPNVSVIYGETTAAFTWLRFSDPTPSSGYARTLFYLGEWTGTAWVGGAPNLFNGIEVTKDINVIEKYVSKLKPGVRYRYTVTHFDKAGNESAYTYREFVTKKQIWAMQYKAGLAQLSLAIYDPDSGVLGSKALRIATPAGIGCFELVGTDVTMTNFRVQTPQGVRTIN
ncbi:DNRLRE domain-containing protein [Paenibacillus tyrfis]|uniref:DNRLRE domain-containing protein n=1 Tax=Paenibacillus tyrfis TaxID=1501230 RepID=UPI000B591DD4|nr:DNRLRE domain-containing protein [Paenibacillus tyrfis]